MPLIIMCGTPVSGKTTRAKEIKDYFEKEHRKKVEIVCEEGAIKKFGYEKNNAFLDSQKEKSVRSYLKSEAMKLLGKDNVVIVDGHNYIKGYRYELYCGSKAAKTTQCTIFTIRNYEEAWESNLKRTKERDGNMQTETSVKETTEELDGTTQCVNGIEKINLIGKIDKETPSAVNIEDDTSEPYSKEVFDALTRFRFEEPNPNHRWDSPLIAVDPTDTLDLTQLYQLLFEKKPPPPNMSTQNPPLCPTNFLYELDKVTNSITKMILEAKQSNVDSEVKFPDYPNCSLEAGFLMEMNPLKLTKLRRQFLTYAKMNLSEEQTTAIGRYFIQYLNGTVGT